MTFMTIKTWPMMFASLLHKTKLLFQTKSTFFGREHCLIQGTNSSEHGDTLVAYKVHQVKSSSICRQTLIIYTEYKSAKRGLKIIVWRYKVTQSCSSVEPFVLNYSILCRTVWFVRNRIVRYLVQTNRYYSLIYWSRETIKLKCRWSFSVFSLFHKLK